MNSLNKVTLIGNLGADPKIIESIKGNKFSTFTLATHDSWKDKEGNIKKETEWHNVVVFNEYLVPFVQSSLKKGDLVYLEGQLKLREWTSEDGQSRIAVEIVLSRFGGDLTRLSVRATLQEKAEDSKAQKKAVKGN